MTQETKPSAITIDGNDYALDDLSANARSQIVNLRVTDQGNRPPADPAGDCPDGACSVRATVRAELDKPAALTAPER